MFMAKTTSAWASTSSSRKKLRIEGQLSSHEKEIKELDNNMEASAHLFGI